MFKLQFQDEAGFGRINTPKYCWTGGQRPAVPCHHIMEYWYIYGAVDPCSAEECFLIAPQYNTACINTFLDMLSKQYSQEHILLICDGAAWHKSGVLVVPDNIHLFHIPPYTPEIKPIEQIWREIRPRSFRKEIFKTLNDGTDRLTETIKSITPDVIRSITGRDQILKLL